MTGIHNYYLSHFRTGVGVRAKTGSKLRQYIEAEPYLELAKDKGEIEAYFYLARYASSAEATTVFRLVSSA